MLHTTSMDAGVRNFSTSSGGASVESLGVLSNLDFVVPANNAEIWKHCGFQRVLFTFEADESKTITSINAVLDIYYVSDSTIATAPVKIGRVSYMGKLVPGAGPTVDPKWTVSTSYSLNFTRNTAAQMPKLVLEIGPGAFITFVIQTLFGTSYGRELCDLQNYTVPK
ncbi:MAG: hypothetical protein HY820_17070 [Acidobacteria bacterium]|nr:hypothetical protein [Acidobacteriota bacterium]